LAVKGEIKQKCTEQKSKVWNKCVYYTYFLTQVGDPLYLFFPYIIFFFNTKWVVPKITFFIVFGSILNIVPLIFF